MKSKTFAVMLLMGLAIPAAILYNIFFQNPLPEYAPIPGFDGYKEAIMALNSNQYQVLDVIDEGALIRVDIVASNTATDRLDARIQTTNALYDVQTIVGKELSVSVWNYRSSTRVRDALQGMAFYHALAEQLTFKSSDELP